MARDIIEVLKPVLDNSESVASVAITEQTVTQANGITIKDAFENKNNTLFIMVKNTGSDSTVIAKAGNAYPNSMLGDLTLAVGSGTTAIQIQDPSRFENADGTLNLDFGAGFTGTVYAVAKRAGLKPVV